MDSTAKAVFESLDGEWTKVVAEARIRGQCEARNDDGLRFMSEAMLKVPPAWLERLGGPRHATVKFEVPASSADDAMANPRRELTIETLKEDPKGMFVELMCHWPQLPDIRPARHVGDVSLRQIEGTPREYIQNAHDFLMKRVSELEEVQ